MAEAARYEPPESDAGKPFWEATRRRELVLPWCSSCGKAHWYPRETCPHCRASTFEWRPASGAASLYAVSVQHRPGWPTLADRVPYPVALVELEEGVRMMSNVVGCAQEELEIGMQLRVTWEELSDGRNLPQFEPA